MPTVSVMETHGNNLTKHIPTETSYAQSPPRDILQKFGDMNLIQAQNWKLKWHLVGTKPGMLLIIH